MTTINQWLFWQYTNCGRLDGYIGKEKHIDLNVFNRSAEEYTSYLQNRTYKFFDERLSP